MGAGQERGEEGEVGKGESWGVGKWEYGWRRGDEDYVAHVISQLSFRFANFYLLVIYAAGPLNWCIP